MNENRNTQTVQARLRMQRHRARQRGEDAPLRKPGPRPARKPTMIPANPGVERGYALNLLSPVRHVATELERAGQRGLTIAELADGYAHSIPGDLSRVQVLHGLDSEMQATRFLIDRAVSALGAGVRRARAVGRYRLAVPFDQLRYEGDELVRYS